LSDRFFKGISIFLNLLLLFDVDRPLFVSGEHYLDDAFIFFLSFGLQVLMFGPATSEWIVQFVDTLVWPETCFELLLILKLVW